MNITIKCIVIFYYSIKKYEYLLLFEVIFCIFILIFFFSILAHVSSEKQLRGGVRFVKEIPKNATGKILRRVLREKLNAKSKL